jgi:hypothetical protein
MLSMRKKTLIISSLLALFIVSSLYAADDNYDPPSNTEDAQIERAPINPDLNASQLSMQEKKTIDNDEKEFEEDQNSIQADADSEQRPQNKPLGVAQRSRDQEQENLQKFQAETQQTRW